MFPATAFVGAQNYDLIPAARVYVQVLDFHCLFQEGSSGFKLNCGGHSASCKDIFRVK